MRGEHHYDQFLDELDEGSSPHARGARLALRLGAIPEGIIPACAGSTRSPRCRGRRARDHPRMRGEHNEIHGLLIQVPGSSPHARGARVVLVEFYGSVGIIPACAGSTQRRCLHGHARRDHPRMRGEHIPPPLCSLYMRGSSPHARGAFTREVAGDGEAGIIPACAGSTGPKATRAGDGRDHPRMRGEHNPREKIETRHKGSSPHARGARSCPYPFSSLLRIIPACAGSTLRFRRA